MLLSTWVLTRVNPTRSFVALLCCPTVLARLYALLSSLKAPMPKLLWQLQNGQPSLSLMLLHTLLALAKLGGTLSSTAVTEADGATVSSPMLELAATSVRRCHESPPRVGVQTRLNHPRHGRRRTSTCACSAR